MVEPAYTVLIPCKNGEKTIEQTLQSIFSQSIQPKRIIVVDDASKDGTPQILRKYPKVLTIRLEHNLPRDFARVPKLINLMLQHVSEPNGFIMISGDDCIYPKDYVELLLEEFEKDSRLLVASGSHMEQKIIEEASPHGAGRVIRYSFLRRVLPFPETIGWESWILFKALQNGGKVKRFPNVSYQHLKPYSSSSVWTFGQSMYELGYPLWFVLARVAKNFLFEPHKFQQLHMLGGFLEYRLKNKAKLDVGDFVRQYQKQRVRNLLVSVVLAKK